MRFYAAIILSKHANMYIYTCMLYCLVYYTLTELLRERRTTTWIASPFVMGTECSVYTTLLQKFLPIFSTFFNEKTRFFLIKINSL